jgi:hypothetical protein
VITASEHRQHHESRVGPCALRVCSAGCDLVGTRMHGEREREQRRGIDDSILGTWGARLPSCLRDDYWPTPPPRPHPTPYALRVIRRDHAGAPPHRKLVRPCGPVDRIASHRPPRSSEG